MRSYLLKTQGGAAVSYAEITVAVNTPPLPGSISVLPARGHSTTRFKGTASGWEDSPTDLPLLYRFASSFTLPSSPTRAQADSAGVLGLRFRGTLKEAESQSFYLPTPPLLSAAKYKSSYAAHTSMYGAGYMGGGSMYGSMYDSGGGGMMGGGTQAKEQDEPPSPTTEAPCHVWVEVLDQFKARSRASTTITMVANLADLYVS